MPHFVSCKLSISYYDYDSICTPNFPLRTINHSYGNVLPQSSRNTIQIAQEMSLCRKPLKDILAFITN